MLIDGHKLKENSSKNVQLLDEKYDHTDHPYFRWFAALSLAYTDQVSTIFVSQLLLSSPTDDNVLVPAKYYLINYSSVSKDVLKRCNICQT